MRERAAPQNFEAGAAPPPALLHAAARMEANAPAKPKTSKAPAMKPTIKAAAPKTAPAPKAAPEPNVAPALETAPASEAAPAPKKVPMPKKAHVPKKAPTTVTVGGRPSRKRAQAVAFKAGPAPPPSKLAAAARSGAVSLGEL